MSKGEKKLSLGYRFFCIASIVLSGGVLTGCELNSFNLVTAGVSAAANDVFKRPDVNLKEKNYAAADYLASQMKGFVRKNETLAIHPLRESDNLSITSPLGMSIAEEIGLRFGSLGYRVSMAEELGAKHQGAMYAPLPPDRLDYAFTGTYLRDQDGVHVSLRVVGAQSGRIIAVFDYTLPLTYEVRKMSETQTQIFRTP